VGRQTGTMAALAISLHGCGTTPGDFEPSPGTELGQTQQFLVWDPGTALVNEHVNWHTPPCGESTHRSCSNQGEDFLVFHRNYLERLRDEYERQGLTTDITPWYSLPSEMKSSSNGWTSALQNAENAIVSMIDPDTGSRFASLDRFGRYVESNYHNALHGLALNAYGESVVGGLMSPKSTYFFKIHGLIEWHFQRFQKGDFNKDGKSDLIVRNRSTGANQVWFMNNSSVSSKNDSSSLSATDGCNWYLGAVADLDYDGNLDMVWHGPGCSRVIARLMNGLTRRTTVELSGVSSAWRLVGAGDLNRDTRPDLVWRNGSTLDLSVWRMNGTSIMGSTSLDIPSGWVTVALADVTDNGIPDLILRKGDISTGVTYAVQYMVTNMALGGLFNFAGLSASPFLTPQAVGRYHAGDEAADLVMLYSPPAAGNLGYSFGTQVSVTMGSPTYSQSSIVSLGANEEIQGPR